MSNRDFIAAAKPKKDDLLKKQKYHRKRQKGLPALSKLKINSGEPEYNMAMFNHMMDFDGKAGTSMPVFGDYAGGDSAGSATASGAEGGAGMGESLQLNEASREQMISELKKVGKNYRWDKYRDEQIYRMYMNLNKPKKIPDKQPDIDKFDDDFTIEQKPRCDYCNALLTDSGECPRCHLGEEDYESWNNNMNEKKEKITWETIDKTIKDDMIRDCLGALRNGSTESAWIIDEIKSKYSVPYEIALEAFRRAHMRYSMEENLDEGIVSGDFSKFSDAELRQLEIDLYDFLGEHNIYPNDGTFSNADNSIADLMLELYIDGDWKHDHLAAEQLVDDFSAENNLLVIRHLSKEIGESDSDWYNAKHTWYFARNTEEAQSQLDGFRKLFNETLADDTDWNEFNKNHPDVNKDFDRDTYGKYFDADGKLIKDPDLQKDYFDKSNRSSDKLTESVCDEYTYLFDDPDIVKDDIDISALARFLDGIVATKYCGDQEVKDKCVQKLISKFEDNAYIDAFAVRTAAENAGLISMVFEEFDSDDDLNIQVSDIVSSLLNDETETIVVSESGETEFEGNAADIPGDVEDKKLDGFEKGLGNQVIIHTLEEND